MSRYNLFMQFMMIVALSVSAQVTSTDSLIVSPAHPTTADSIMLTIVIPNWDCCTVYYEDSMVTSANDTELVLAYQYQQPQICPMIACMNIGKQLPYKSGPLKAGTYAVYEVKSIYCTTVCPQVAFIPVKIGTVTVSASTLVRSPARIASVSQSLLSGNAKAYFNIKGERLSIQGLSKQSVGVYLTRFDANKTLASCGILEK